MANGPQRPGGASLQTLDQIRDALTERGLGTSGLLTQAVQRAGLPQLQSELQTSGAIRRAEQRRQVGRHSAAAGVARGRALQGLVGADPRINILSDFLLIQGELSKRERGASGRIPKGMEIEFRQQQAKAVLAARELGIDPKRLPPFGVMGGLDAARNVIERAKLGESFNPVVKARPVRRPQPRIPTPEFRAERAARGTAEAAELRRARRRAGVPRFIRN